MSKTNPSPRFRRLAATAALAFGATIGLAGSTASAGTSTVDFSSSTSLKGRGSFQGSATLDGDLLTVQLTNTSSRGFLYGLAFDTAGGKATDETADGRKGFRSAAGKHGLSVKPFGRYTDAIVVKGSARHGVGAGADKTFVFSVGGASAGMTAYDLLDNTRGESVVAMFKGFRHGGKDKAGAAVVLRLASSDLTSGAAGGSTNGTAGGSAGTGGGAGSTIAPPTLISPAPGGTGKTGGTGSTGGTGNPGGAGNPGGTGGTGGLGGGAGLPGAGDPAPAAVPLPAAAWPGLGTLALMAVAAMKRKTVRVEA